MTMRINHKKMLLDELDRLAALPGNWDENGATPPTPRATGNYKAFIDLVTEPKKEYFPHANSDGSIRVEWKTKVGGKAGTALIVFKANGGMKLEFNGNSNDFDAVDHDRLRNFVYIAG